MSGGAAAGTTAAQRGRVVGWLRRAIDAVLPPRCLSCGTEIAPGGAVCAGCWRRLTPIASPFCTCCGLPFTIPVEGAGARCGACHAEPPAFDRARAPLLYDAVSRKLVLAFKHADATHAAPALAGWIRRATAPLADEAEVIVPVPLHPRRLLARRYNQAALLALGIGREAGRPVLVDALLRRRATPSQGGLGRAGRRRNVQGAFALRPSAAPAIVGRRVLLVDDVLTTGATVDECARILRRGAAAAVDVAVLARVPGPDQTGHVPDSDRESAQAGELDKWWA